MSEDAQAPEARGNPAGGTPPRAPHAHDDVWAAPADSGAAQAQPPQSPPREVSPPEPTQVDLGGHGTSGPSGSAAVTDPFALPEFDPPAPAPGTPGAPRASGAPSAPSVHDQRTVTSLPAASAPATSSATPPARPWAGPSGSSTPPAGPGVAASNPFAPPATEPVPPPPIAPGGPGQVPYGYPGGHGSGYQGGYAHPAAQPPAHAGAPAHGGLPDQGYGWTGVPPQPANGMGVTGLVLGIISACVFCLWPLAVGLGVLAVIFSALGRGKAARGEATNPGHALAGLLCGGAGIVLGGGFGLLVTLF
ncbi:hypothetical protein ACFU5P_16560 [Streptomyces sp. NPDC057433]|uniref:hypothetical protein n=1 Tax=Streptomyces sp. NPDC057433 TaxID=3346132 RepID=UPI0036D15122